MSALAVDPAGSTATPATPRGDVVLLTCNDLHLTDVPPAARIDTYVDEMFDLLDQIERLAIKLRARAVCIAGDIFHHKDRPMGAGLLTRLMQWCTRLRAYDVDVLVIPGNHDLRYNQLGTLNLQPLGVMLRADKMRDVSVEPIEYGDVQVVGVPYPHATDLGHWRNVHETYRYPGRRLVLGHCFASEKGGDYFGEPVLKYTMVADACPASVYVFGHDHSDGGVTQLGNRTFVNLGALSRGTTKLDDITRDIKIGLVTFGPDFVAVKQVRLNYRPASELFDLDAKARKDDDHRRIEAYVAQLEAQLASLDSTTSVDDHLRTLQIPDDVRTRMDRYISEAEA